MDLFDADKLSEISQFQMQCLRARQSNRAVCIRYKLLFSGGKELFKMTPQEELHAKLFNHEVQLVKDMDVLQLRAHREELAKIAFEARARLGATDEVLKTKEKKSPKAPGFSRSLQMDDVSSDAINSINEHQKKLTKDEKMIERMRKMGISEEYIQSTIMSNMKIHKQIQKENIIEGQKKLEASKPILTQAVNPFAVKKIGE